MYQEIVKLTSESSNLGWSISAGNHTGPAQEIPKAAIKQSQPLILNMIVDFESCQMSSGGGLVPLIVQKKKTESPHYLCDYIILE